MQKKREICLLFLSPFSVDVKVLETPLNWSCAIKTSFILYFKTPKRLEMIESYERFHSPLKTQLGVLSSVLLLPVGNF